jgi:hypothetical protein
MIIQFRTGNFVLNVSGSLNAAAEAKMLENGMRWTIQRDVATAVYLALGGVENDKGNKVLPDGFERDNVAFDTANASAFHATAEKALATLGEFSVSVDENVGGEGGAMKNATRLVDSFLGDASEPAWRAIIGLPDGDRDALIKECHARKLGMAIARKTKSNKK